MYTIKRFEDKIAAVTGGAKGIGKGLLPALRRGGGQGGRPRPGHDRRRPRSRPSASG